MRIPSQVPAASTLRELQRNFLDINRLNERIASGSRIHRGSDAPAALVLSERLRAELSALSQAGENVARVGNVLNTAEGAFSQVGDLLARGQALSLQAANAQSPEELQAAQGELDSLVDGIRRIGSGTSFAGQKLTNGAQSFTVQNPDPAFSRIEVSQTRAGFAPATVSVNVGAAATRGQAVGAIAAAQAGDAEVQIRGSLGTALIRVGDTASRADVAAAINGVKDQTGVEADAATGVVRAFAVGSENFAEIRNLSGTLTGVTEGSVAGTDVAATVGGRQASANGNVIQVENGDLRARITLAEGTGPGTIAFQVSGGGLRFQAGDGTNPDEGGVLGIPSILPSELGRSANPAGLESVVTGGANSLANNPSGAADVFASALGDLGRSRGQLGALQKNFFEGLSNSLQVTFENLSASESSIRDTDFAQTLAELAVKRIRSQAGIAALRQQNLEAGNVLRLLG